MHEDNGQDFESVAAVVRRHSTETPGGFAAIALARHDGPVGSASFLHGRRLPVSLRSAVASITKPITATAVMQLVASGTIALDEPISTYLPRFDPGPPPGMATTPAVTIRHVLSHTSGLDDHSDEELRRLELTPEAMLDAIGHQRLRFEPGSAFAYASEPWYLLSAVIERVSGLRYPAYLRSRIFEPLGMTATTFDPRDPGPDPLPPEGSFPLEHLSADELVALIARLSMPAGGLWSTPEDVATFGRAMLLGGAIGDARVAHPASVDEMTRHATAHLRDFDTGEPVHYALGWGRPGRSAGSPASESAFTHAGATGSMLLVDPAHDVVIAYLRNWWGVSMTATDEAISAVYRGL